METTTKLRRTRRQGLKRTTAIVMSAFLLGGTFAATNFSPAPPPAAQAFDEHGAGINVGGIHVGAYIHSDGEFVYCVDMPLECSRFLGPGDLSVVH